MPLDEHIEGGHGERKPGVKIGPDPVQVVYLLAADNCFSPKTRYNPPITPPYKYQTKSILTQSWYNTSSTSNRFAWRMPHDLMRG
jgi:hypothetical protein